MTFRSTALHLVLGSLFCLLPTSLNAQRELGGERVGTSAFTFLKIAQGARAQALGGAYTALGADASSVFWNPAGIGQREARFDGLVGQMNWIADMRIHMAALAMRTGGVHHLAVSAVALSTAPMEVTTEYQPGGTGEFFQYGDVMVGLTYSQRMTDRFSFGITGKMVEEQLADTYMRGYLIDLGTFYRTGFRDLNFGVALLNFGRPAKPEGMYIWSTGTGLADSSQYQEFSPPTIFRMAIAYEWLQAENQSLTTTVQLNHPVDQSESRTVGLEYGIGRRIFLRAGVVDKSDAQSWSLGTGIVLAGFHLDYAFTNMSELGGIQRFTLGWSW